MKKIAITGHRPPRLLGQEEMIRKWGREQLLQLQPSVMYNGMAEGTDKLFALLAKQLDIPIVCCYAFPKKSYRPIENYIMENNIVTFISPVYSKESFIKRDFFMVDQADILLCVWDGIPGGGTYLTRNYALQKNKQIIDYKGLRK